LGAAYLAGLGVGFWDDTSSIANQWNADITFSPNMDDQKIQEHYAGWHRAVERAKGWKQE